MSLHLYRIDAPGSDLDGEPVTIDDPSQDAANARAEEYVRQVFALSRRTDVTLTHVATFSSRETYRKARDAAFESGVVLVGNTLKAVGS